VVGPENDARAVEISTDHVPDEGNAGLGRQQMLATGEFLKHVEAQFVAELDEALAPDIDLSAVARAGEISTVLFVPILARALTFNANYLHLGRAR
jgi:hypothetical protein